MNEIIDDCKWFADKHREKNKQSGPHWSTIIRFTPLFDEAVRLQQRVDTLEAYITDYIFAPRRISKDEARKKINDIFLHALTERKEDYYLDGKYFRWGKLEKDICEVIDSLLVQEGLPDDYSKHVRNMSDTEYKNLVNDNWRVVNE